MCILFLFVSKGGTPPPPKGAPPLLKLVVASNRDEFYARPTRLAQFWDSDPHILAGQDLEEGGTWLGVSRLGKLAILLNIMGPAPTDKRRSRGDLVTGFLRAPPSLRGSAYSAHLYDTQDIQNNFGRFNLITADLGSGGSPAELTYLTNVTGEGPRSLEGGGVFGFGNSAMNTPFCKVREGCPNFNRVMQPYATQPLSSDVRDKLEEQLLQFLSSTDKHFPDPQMQKQSQGTKVPPSLLPELSSLFVKSPLTAYGTRTHTILIVDTNNHVSFHEWTMKEPIDCQNPQWLQSKFEFDIEQ